MNLTIFLKSFIIPNIKYDIDNYLVKYKKIESKHLYNLYIGVSSIKYSLSYIFHIVKLEYSFAFYDLNNSLIIPSDITLYYSLHIFCNSFDINNNISIISISYIIQNKYFNCIEYFNINEKMNIGITIYKKVKYFEYITINLFTEKLINYNHILLRLDDEFDPFIIINNHIKLEKKIL